MLDWNEPAIKFYEKYGSRISGGWMNEVYSAMGLAPTSKWFSADGTTYVICRSGARSMRVCELAASQGYDVANVTGGTMAWILSRDRAMELWSRDSPFRAAGSMSVRRSPS